MCAELGYFPSLACGNDQTFVPIQKTCRRYVVSKDTLHIYLGQGQTLCVSFSQWGGWVIHPSIHSFTPQKPQSFLCVWDLAKRWLR